MDFDPTTAKPLDFDPESAKAVEEEAPKKKRDIRTLVDRYTGGAAEAAVSLATTPAQMIAGGLANIAGSVMPGPPGQGGDLQQKVSGAIESAPRLGEPMSPEGAAIHNVVTKPFQWLGQGAEWLQQKIEGDQPGIGRGLLGTATNTAVNLAPAVLGMISGRAGAPMQARLGRLEQEAQTNTSLAKPFTDEFKEFKQAGYKTSPTQVNPSLTNRVIEGLGGEAKVAKSLSLDNQRVTNDLVRKDFNIPSDQPLHPSIFDGIIKNAAKDWDVVAQTGRVSSDAALRSDMESIIAPYRKMKKDFSLSSNQKKAFSELDSLTTSARNGFNADTAISKISGLREAAETEFKSGSRSIGRAYKAAATALEEALDRHLQKTGAAPDVIEKFRAARETMAKAYTAKEALTNENIDAHVLASDKQKLTGGMKTAADFASRFPKNAQLPEKSGGNPIGFGDIGIGGLGWALTGHGPAAAAVLARPAIRAGIGTDAGQALLSRPPAYGPGIIPRGLAAIEDNPLPLLFGPQAGQQ